MPHHSPTLRKWILLGIAALSCIATHGQDAAKARKVQTPQPTHPPLQAVEIARLPAGTERLDLFLLIGQSNMKGRGVMPDEPERDCQESGAVAVDGFAGNQAKRGCRCGL